MDRRLLNVFRNSLGGNEENYETPSFSIAGVLVEIQTEHLPTTEALSFDPSTGTTLPYDININNRAPFAKFVDSPYYYESELCGGAVTVCFSKYLPWQAMHFLQRSTHFSKTCCRPLITSKFLVSELPFHGWKSPEIARGEIWAV
jgi:hypothetical protein